MDVIVMESEAYQKLIEKINNLEQLLLSVTSEKKPEPKKEAPSFNWIRIEKALELLDVSRSFWDKDLKHEIKWRKYGHVIWVYRPSIDSFLMDKSIN